MPLCCGLVSACDRACLEAFLAFDAEPDQGADLAAHLDRLVAGEVAQMLDLDLACRVLVHGERVDHAHRVAVAELLQLPP